MQRRAFFYDLARKSWKECMNPDYVTSDMNLVPVHQIVHRRKSVSTPVQQEVWCAEHHAYEAVDKLNEMELTTKDGCHMHGLLQGGFHWQEDEPAKIQFSPIRWRVIYHEHIGSVALIQDIPEVWWGRNTFSSASILARINLTSSFPKNSRKILTFWRKNFQYLPQLKCAASTRQIPPASFSTSCCRS